MNFKAVGDLIGCLVLSAISELALYGIYKLARKQLNRYEESDFLLEIEFIVNELKESHELFLVNLSTVYLGRVVALLPLKIFIIIGRGSLLLFPIGHIVHSLEEYCSEGLPAKETPGHFRNYIILVRIISLIVPIVISIGLYIL